MWLTLGSAWTADAAVTRDPTVAHRGGASMHAHVPALSHPAERGVVEVVGRVVLDDAEPLFEEDIGTRGDGRGSILRR